MRSMRLIQGAARVEYVTVKGSSDQDRWLFSRSPPVFYGNGDGTFQEAANLWTGDDPYQVAISDLDGDGNADLIATFYDNDYLSVVSGRLYGEPGYLL